MSNYTSEEIAAILSSAELLQQKGAARKINISEFCKDAGISRKNAYKHKKKIDKEIQKLKEKNRHLEKECHQIKQKLILAEQRAGESDLYSGVREVLFEAIKYNYEKKNLIGTTEQKKLIKDYNKIADSHGLERLDFWE
jgi:hypothetical protein